MTVPERKLCRPLPASQKLTNLGSIIHLVHKYNIGHKMKEEEMLTKNLHKCLNEQ